jgi:hypothetical protein
MVAGDVPKTCYMINNKSKIGPDMDSITVAQGTKIELKYDVESVHSALR